MAEYAHLQGVQVNRPMLQFDRLIPIATSLPTGGVPTPGGPPSSKSASDFFPIDPTGGVAVLKGEKGAEPGFFFRMQGDVKLYGFSLSPDQISPNWIEEIPLRFGTWLRNWLVRFVSDVSGALGNTTPDSLMLDPFAKLKEAMDQARPKQGDLQLPTQADPFSIPNPSGESVQFDPQNLPPSTSFPATHGFDSTLNTLMELAKKIVPMRGTTRDILAVYEYLMKRQSARDQAVVNWMTVPWNLGQVFLSSNMKAATQTALYDIGGMFGRTDIDRLLGEVLDSESYVPFFNLVAVELSLYEWSKKSFKTAKEHSLLDKKRNEWRYRILNGGLQRSAVPFTEPDMRLDSAARASRW